MTCDCELSILTSIRYLHSFCTDQKELGMTQVGISVISFSNLLDVFLFSLGRQNAITLRIQSIAWSSFELLRDLWKRRQRKFVLPQRVADWLPSGNVRNEYFHCRSVAVCLSFSGNSPVVPWPYTTVPVPCIHFVAIIRSQVATGAHSVSIAVSGYSFHERAQYSYAHKSV